MKNILAICEKELNSYFASPIAYLTMAMFAILFRLLLLELSRPTSSASACSPWRWDARSRWMSTNGRPPAAAEHERDRAVPDPDDCDASLLRREALGTIELLLTSPVHDAEIVIGKWLAALWPVWHAAVHQPGEHRIPVPLRQAGLAAAWRPDTWA